VKRQKLDPNMKKKHQFSLRAIVATEGVDWTNTAEMNKVREEGRKKNGMQRGDGEKRRPPP